jgi:hypothetical protein
MERNPLAADRGTATGRAVIRLGVAGGLRSRDFRVEHWFPARGDLRLQTGLRTADNLLRIAAWRFRGFATCLAAAPHGLPLGSSHRIHSNQH